MGAFCVCFDGVTCEVLRLGLSADYLFVNYFLSLCRGHWVSLTECSADYLFINYFAVIVERLSLISGDDYGVTLSYVGHCQ